jgi:cytochrome c-type biogenesis protein
MDKLKIPERFLKKGKIGSFLMGFGFSLAFCPTMFVLFFVTLMPLVYSTSYGVLLPSIFAVGTSVPVIFFILILWYLGFNGTLMKKGKQAGRFVQKAAGIVMIFLGILDTITYWL